MKNLTHKVLFELGDWSQDGHNQSSKFRVLSNKPVEATRDAHFAFKEKYFDIGEICSEYGEGTITNEHQIEVLKDLNLWNEEFAEYIEIDDLAELWMKLLQVIDPELQYEIQTETEWPKVHFYGFDSQSRHLEVPGYGLYQ